jgi:catechol 2,3-dioxygenase-like lactoylglutathione lyase family enzyme
MTIRIRNIDHVVIRVRDVGRALGFYRDVLGCAVERELAGRGLIQLRAGSSLIDLVEVDSEFGRKLGAAPASAPEAGGRNMDHFCLRVEPFDAPAILAALRAAGLNPGEVAQRYGAEGNGPSIYVEDPDGNTVELKGPPSA